MSTDHVTHETHDHVHGDGCGHVAARHGDHVDYLHDGHAHRAHDGHYDECDVSDVHVVAEDHGDHVHGDGSATRRSSTATTSTTSTTDTATPPTATTTTSTDPASQCLGSTTVRGDTDGVNSRERPAGRMYQRCIRTPRYGPCQPGAAGSTDESEMPVDPTLSGTGR